MIRAEFDLALDEAVARSDLSQKPLCVLFVDVDGFTAINDSLGHDVGDQVLCEVARRLHAATPDKAAAARVSGDTFLLLIEAGLEEAKAMAQRVLTAVAEPLQAGNPRPIVLATSIGIAAYPLHGARQRLVPQAHTALRAVKQAGGRAWAVFDPQMAVDQRALAALVADLRLAAAGQQFELFYQPKVDARNLQVTAAEALLRWHHPTQGVISPAVFIPLAERHGLIGELGNWVIEEACRQAGIWRQAGLRMRVAINLSAYQMRQDDLVPRIEAALAKHRLQPGRFTVEITESLALENTAATQRTFEGLCRAGLHVAIDDFGAGQTSLAYLRQLPASELKMDMSLVQDLETSADARAIAEAVIKLAHALERRVVAEGVETAAQRDLLVRMGCDELQGYLFAKPMSATALGLWAMDDEFAHQPAFSASLFQDSQPAM
jgi:diguanylate cyclase (GGDEF)-like protein